MISESKIEEIKSATDIVDIISQFVNIRARGRTYFGLCPFHSEKTPSFAVNPAKQMYKCFGCGRSGDVIEFLKEQQGMDFPSAIMYLAERVNIQIEQYEDPNERLYDIMEAWNNEFKSSIKTNGMAMDYLTRRGISRQEIDKFEIGFCAYRDPADAFLIGYDSVPDLRKCGILSSTGNLLFSSRITFPIRNARGKLIGFSARTVQASPASHKYINSATSVLYEKDRSLYGLKMARSIARLRNNFHLMEGYTDVIAAHRAGYSNSGAACGTAFTEHHAAEIKKMCNRVTFWFDGDNAGREAARRAIGIALAANLNVSLKLLPEGEDVYSVVNAGGDLSRFKDSPIASLYSSSKGEDSFSAGEKINEVMTLLTKITDPIVRDLELNQLSRSFGVSYRVLINQYKQQTINVNNGTNIRRPSRMGGRNGYQGRNF